MKKNCYWDLFVWHKTNPIPTCNNKYLSDTEYCLIFREEGTSVNYGNYKTKSKYYISEINKKDRYKGETFFEWHHYLTGSCLQGREAFVKDKGLSLEDTYTVREFLEIVRGSYGWKNLEELTNYYGGNKND